jgi:hypothetical protein
MVSVSAFLGEIVVVQEEYYVKISRYDSKDIIDEVVTNRGCVTGSITWLGIFNVFPPIRLTSSAQNTASFPLFTTGQKMP